MEKGRERERAERSDKKKRVNSSYTQQEFEQLDRLSMAIGLTPTELQTYFTKYCMGNEAMVNDVQDQFKHKARFRIIPSRVNGELKFIFAEKVKK